MKIKAVLFDCDGLMFETEIIAQQIWRDECRRCGIELPADFFTHITGSGQRMKDTLDRLGVRCGFYIPDRFREGYGLHPETVELAAEKGYGLILTVDNGVKAHDPEGQGHRSAQRRHAD